MGRFPLAMLLVMGCYHPTASLDVPCGPGDACPSGQACVGDRCVLEGTQGLVDGAADPDALVDGPPVDATLLDSPAATTGDAGGDAMPVVISWKSTTTSTVPMAGAGSVTVARPTFATGNVFVAEIAMGNTGATTSPVFTAPTGWTLVRRVNRNNDTSLLTYWHVTGATEPTTYTWQFSTPVEGVAWISCYAGVDTTAPIEIDAGSVIETTGPAYAAPGITTTTPNAMVLATFVSHAGSPTTWTTPTGTTARANLNNASTRSGLGADKLFANAGATGSFTATASSTQDYAIVEVVALNPAP